MKILRNDRQNPDELDLMILRELERDARISYLALASKVKGSRMTVERRVKRLVDNGTITIAVLPAWAKLGYKITLLLAINAPPGMVDRVAEQLSAANSINLVWITSGRYDILATAMYRSTEEYAERFPAEMANIPPNVKLEIMSLMNFAKSPWPHLVGDLAVASQSHFAPTELDFSLIGALEKSPRATVCELAKDIRANRATVRSHLRRLASRGISRVVSIHNPAAYGQTIMGVTLIQVHPSELRNLAEKLKAYPCVDQISLVLGAFNCIIWTTFQDTEQMHKFLDRDLGNMHGIVHFQNLLRIRLQKRVFNLSAAVGQK